jgi:hypothetical protein
MITVTVRLFAIHLSQLSVIASLLLSTLPPLDFQNSLPTARETIQPSHRPVAAWFLLRPPQRRALSQLCPQTANVSAPTYRMDNEIRGCFPHCRRQWPSHYGTRGRQRGVVTKCIARFDLLVVYILLFLRHLRTATFTVCNIKI